MEQKISQSQQSLIRKLILSQRAKQIANCKAEHTSALGFGVHYIVFTLLLTIICFSFLKGCADEVEVQEQQAKNWQQQFERGEPVNIHVRVGGEK